MTLSRSVSLQPTHARRARRADSMPAPRAAAQLPAPPPTAHPGEAARSRQDAHRPEAFSIFRDRPRTAARTPPAPAPTSAAVPPGGNEPARTPRGPAPGRDGANAGSRPFTFGELQLQLGQPGPHLQGQRHALEAAVRHARAAEMGSALLPLSPFVRSRKGARENGGAAPDAKVLRRRLSGACTGEAVRAGDGARREGMRRFLLSSPLLLLLLLLPRRFLQRGPAMAAPAAAARSRSLRIGSRRARPAAAAPPALPAGSPRPCSGPLLPARLGLAAAPGAAVPLPRLLPAGHSAAVTST